MMLIQESWLVIGKVTGAKTVENKSMNGISFNKLNKCIFTECEI